jgi:hypothetical protein
MVALSEAMAANGYRDLLRERSSGAIRDTLSALSPRNVEVYDVEGYENLTRDEHFWVIRFGLGAGGLWRKPPMVAMIRVPVGPLGNSVNPQHEFYRRAEKRLKLFAELCRD